MTTPTGGSTTGIKLKFSLGSLSSNQAGPSTPTPAAPKSKKHVEAPRAELNGSLERSKKGKGKAVNGHAEVATHQPTILRLTTGSLKGIKPEEPPANGPAPTLKLKKPPKLKNVNGASTVSLTQAPSTPTLELDGSSLAGPSTPTPLPAIPTPATPFTPATSSAVSTPMAARSRASTSSISRTGQHVSRHGKILGRPRGSRTKPPSRQPLKPSERTGKHVFRKPSAIPPRLLSSTPSTPRATAVPPITASPATPAARSASPVKLEPDVDIDPLGKSLSPAAAEITTPQTDGLVTEPQTPMDAPKVVKGKKPIKELMQRVMVQLFKKDEYAFFFEPVDLEAIPGYLDVIGGEDKMMDLGTMQAKVDNGEYSDFDQFTDDLRTLVTAAKTYNPGGSIPYVYAQKILVLGEKQIEKSRPLVATPEPTPDRGLSESGTPWSAREGTTGLDHTEDIPTNLYIPEEMLHFPPNSPYALAVGWNLTGGRRVYSKRQIRGREKFSGKWRHWDLDGSRDWAEAEHPEKLLASRASTMGNRMTIDWKGLRRTGPWWEFEIGGPNGIPPFAFTPFPRPAEKPTRELDTFDWGPYPECEAELALASARQALPQSEVLRETLRPTKPKSKPGPPTNFINIYNDSHSSAGEWLRDMVYGDVTGEAYSRSVKKFVEGAMASRTTPNSNPIPLDDYVRDTWHNGVLKSETSDVVRSTLHDLSDLRSAQKRSNPLSDRNQTMLKVATNAYHRQAMRYLTRPGNPLDLAALLKTASDFSYVGIGNKGGVSAAAEWIKKEILRLANESGDPEPVNGKRKRVKEEVEPSKRVKLDSSKFDSTTSSPLSEVPDSPRPDETGSEDMNREEALTKLRLELVALCKYYPLSALKKMSKEDAARLLPASVRQLMSKQD